MQEARSPAPLLQNHVLQVTRPPPADPSGPTARKLHRSTPAPSCPQPLCAARLFGRFPPDNPPAAKPAAVWLAMRNPAFAPASPTRPGVSRRTGLPPPPATRPLAPRILKQPRDLTSAA